MLQGDMHRLYRQLRRAYPDPPSGAMRELDHIREIKRFYRRLSPADRRLLLAWARKEESGIGLIPTALSGVPLLGLMFAPLLHAQLRLLPSWAWLFAWGIAAVTFTAGVYVHQRQKAYSMLHIEILQQLESARGEPDQLD